MRKWRDDYAPGKTNAFVPAGIPEPDGAQERSVASFVSLSD
jgi:hypothetical protein